jgi:hypothetical protein
MILINFDIKHPAIKKLILNLETNTEFRNILDIKHPAIKKELQ